MTTTTAPAIDPDELLAAVREAFGDVLGEGRAEPRRVTVDAGALGHLIGLVDELHDRTATDPATATRVRTEEPIRDVTDAEFDELRGAVLEAAASLVDELAGCSPAEHRILAGHLETARSRARWPVPPTW